MKLITGCEEFIKFVDTVKIQTHIAEHVIADFPALIRTMVRLDPQLHSKIIVEQANFNLLSLEATRDDEKITELFAKIY